MANPWWPPAWGASLKSSSTGNLVFCAARATWLRSPVRSAGWPPTAVSLVKWERAPGSAQIVGSCLESRGDINRNSPVAEVEITVVSDGSTDRTVELASSFIPRINLIVFEKNRGYGAAIKEAWRQSDAELLSFLDADG